jgi:signal transduction histidine kinase
MDQQAESLRDFLTKSKRPKESPQIFRIRRLVEEVILNLEAFAKEKRVELRFKGSQDDAMVKAVERDVRGALTSVLHNAIKYSWKMLGSQSAWVKILCYTSKRDVFIAFENWGVPIHNDEIEQGLIFQMGYRGTLSGDRGRLGTGLGLHDAWQTAKESGGEITVRSEPSNDVYRQDPYKKAYITTVTFKLPIYKSETVNKR